jgi:hypothetical protein
VAAWLSETALRGHGPGASGFESRRRGRIFFQGRNLRSPAAPHKEKERKKQADRKTPDGPGVVKGERLQKKNSC